jgi:hypothetical protein
MYEGFLCFLVFVFNLMMILEQPLVRNGTQIEFRRMCNQQVIPDFVRFLRSQLMMCICIANRCDLFVLLFSDQLAAVHGGRDQGDRAGDHACRSWSVFKRF